MQQKDESSLQIAKFLQKISDLNDHKIGIIHGLEKSETEQVIKDSVSLIADQDYTRWKIVKEVDHYTCVQDIQDLLLDNIQPENLGSYRKSNRLSPRKKIWTWFLRKKINKIKNLKLEGNEQNKNPSGRARTVLWTIVSALSSLGLAMGIPLFSLLLYRQQEIINGSLGYGFFIGFLSFSVILIIMAILGTVVSLINNLINQKKEYSWQNIDKLYSNIINRYFTIENSSSPWKFNLKKSYFFFYTNLDPDHQNYLEIINLFKIIQMANSVVICSMNVKHEIDFKKVASDIGNDAQKCEFFALNEYKNHVASTAVLNFILWQIERISGFNPEILMQKYPLFINAIYRFIDFSTTNRQLLDFCIQMKNFVGTNIAKMGDFGQEYFVDLFVLSVLKGLNPSFFENFVQEILNNGLPSKATSSNIFYKNLQIDHLLNVNLMHFKKMAILLRIRDFIKNGLTLGEIVDDHVLLNQNNLVVGFEQTISEMETTLKKRGCRIVDCYDSWYDFRFISSYKIYIYVKNLTKMMENGFYKPLELIQTVLLKAKSKDIKELVVLIYGEKQFYQLINFEYRLIASVFN